MIFVVYCEVNNNYSKKLGKHIVAKSVKIICLWKGVKDVKLVHLRSLTYNRKLEKLWWNGKHSVFVVYCEVNNNYSRKLGKRIVAKSVKLICLWKDVKDVKLVHLRSLTYNTKLEKLLWNGKHRYIKRVNDG